MQKSIARIAWLVPLALLGLAINQADVARDIHETLRDGVLAVATVTDYERVDRADVTYGYVSLDVRMPDGATFTRDRMSLPHTLMQQLGDDVETLEVLVLPGADQDVVVAVVAQTQWKIAAIQAAISFVAALMALAGVLGWNRLMTRGDGSDVSGAAPLGRELSDESVISAEFMPNQLH